MMQLESTNTSFHWADYLVFFLSLAVSLCVGFFLCIQGRKRKASSDAFLIGEGTMSPISVGLSLTASLLNGVFLIGGPAEVYYHGALWALTGVAYFLIGFPLSIIIIPIFRNIKMTSSYKYLGVRFNSVVAQLAGAVVFSLSIMLFLAVVLYAPALAFSQVTGLNIHLIQIVCGLVCTVYVFLGGIKAVVWTDAIQMVVIVVGTVTIAAIGVSKVGGAGRVWDIVTRDNRINLDTYSADPRRLYTLWTQVIGQVFVWLPVFGSNQMIIQRYLAVATTRDANIALWICAVVANLLLALVTVCGLVMYAYFVDCDPVTSQRVDKADQIFPLLLMEVLGEYHGLPGLYTAAVFSAALSSVSSAVNALAAVFLEDFIKPLYRSCTKQDITEKAATLTSRGLCLLFGLLTIALSYVAPYMGGAIIQIPSSIWGVTGAPLFGMFVLAMFFPCANAVGAIIGLVVSLTFALWLSIGGIFYGKRTPPLRPLGTQCCFPEYTTAAYINMSTEGYSTTAMDMTSEAWESLCLQPQSDPEDNSSLTDFYSISYCWYGLINLLMCVLVGLLASLIVDGIKYGCEEKGKSLDADLVYDCGGRCCCCCPATMQVLCQCGVQHDGNDRKYVVDNGHSNPGLDVNVMDTDQSQI